MGFCNAVGLPVKPSTFRDHFQTRAIRAGSYALASAAFLRDAPSDLAFQFITGTAAGTLGGWGANQLGEWRVGPTPALNFFEHKLAHGVLGAGMGAILDPHHPLKGAAAGFIGGFASETATETFEHFLGHQWAGNAGTLSGPFLALLLDQNVDVASATASNAIVNNFDFCFDLSTSYEEAELKSKGYAEVFDFLTEGIPELVSFKENTHAHIDNWFNLIQDLPFVNTLRSLHERYPFASHMLPLPVQGAVYSRSLSHLGVDFTMPVSRLDLGLTCTAAGKGLGMGGKFFALERQAGKISPVWKLTPITRGEVIEQALGQNLPKTCKTIDKFSFDHGIATSIKSIDLDAKTYQDLSKFNNKLTKYVNIFRCTKPSNQQWISKVLVIRKKQNS